MCYDWNNDYFDRHKHDKISPSRHDILYQFRVLEQVKNNS
jgi:hypothetical protein